VTAVNLIHLLTSLFVALLITGCVNGPKSNPTPYETYMDSDCAHLSATMLNTRAKFAEYFDKQDAAANLITGGVFFISTPLSPFARDIEVYGSELKGKIDDIEKAQTKKKCIANV
jgi:hypothetical protein